jgi:hypothetical protein
MLFIKLSRMLPRMGKTQSVHSGQPKKTRER